MMIVNILEASRRLGEALSFSFITSGNELEATYENYTFEGDILVEGTITNTGRSYRLEGTISCQKVFDCDRCLEHTVQKQKHDFKEEFCQGAGIVVSSVGEEQEIGAEDVSYNYFEGDFIDLKDLVRDTLLAAQPLSNICREDCKGLCLKCGANLNFGDCGCDRFIPDPRLVALKQLLS